MHAPAWSRAAGLAALLVLAALAETAAGIRWLAVANNGKRYWNRTSECSKSKTQGLKKPQVNICKRNLELMPVVSLAVEDAVHMCQDMFRDRRWNCSSVTRTPNYMADLTGGSREQAFVYALSSAALTQAISRACAVGATAKCSCGRLPNEAPPGEFKWGGCGDDVRFGSIFSRMFTDSPLQRRKNSKRNQMNIHNNLAGRTIVENSLSTACKCHGVSGSCSIKTCWKALPDVRAIASALKHKYATAIEVRPLTTSSRSRNPKEKDYNTIITSSSSSSSSSSLSSSVSSVPVAGDGPTVDLDDDEDDSTKGVTKKRVRRERRLVPVVRDKQFFEESDLIYITKSPDYCLPDASLGSIGTHGRECSKDNKGSGGCQSMCCGRGYTSEKVQVKHRCDCKYYWCCYVKCKTCTKEVEINRCR